MAETNPQNVKHSGYIMDETKLKSIIDSEIWSSLGYIQSETTGERQKALEYYLRRPYGNEVEGKSQIVTGEVAEAVDGALPQLIRVFTSSDSVVEFTPEHEGDQELADGATTYVNHVFYKDNDDNFIITEQDVLNNIPSVVGLKVGAQPKEKEIKFDDIREMNLSLNNLEGYKDAEKSIIQQMLMLSLK